MLLLKVKNDLLAVGRECSVDHNFSSPKETKLYILSNVTLAAAFCHRFISACIEPFLKSKCPISQLGWY